MGRVVHFEVHAENPQRAVEFYSNVLGWKFQKWEGPEDYWLINTGPDNRPGINGGLIKRRGKIDGQAVIAYVCTVDCENVDKTVNHVIENKGSIALPKSVIPGVGWLAYCKDTEGNIFGLMQNDPNAK